MAHDPASLILIIGNFLIINKPFGISCVGYKQKNGGIYHNTRINRNDLDLDNVNTLSYAYSVVFHEPKPANELTISSVLPYLSAKFAEPRLQFCFGLKRYSLMYVSGPVVLPCNKKYFKKLKVSTLRYHPDELNEGFHHRALAICKGIPFKLKGHVKGSAVFEEVGEHSEYIFLQNSKFGRRALRAKFAVTGSMDYSVLKSAYGCSLIDIVFAKFNRHLPRLMLTSILCPILGDHMYMRRVVSIDGERKLISPKNLYRSRQVKDDYSFFSNRLQLTATEFSNLPLYWHVYRTTFPLNNSEKSEESMDLIASCPLPTHMTEMLKNLEMYDVAIRHLEKIEEKISSQYVNA
uniref:DUF362 domain-containing protein n=1 Tax=Syphacia muris TaxID=451379 RepID=A0A0N5ASS4_9BILA